MHPRVLVLDEPTSALDPTAAEDVLAILSRLVHDVGIAVVLAEHRLERVVPFADVMVLVTGHDGAVVTGDPVTMLRDSPVAPPIVELGRAVGWDPLPLTVRDARRRARGLEVVLPAPEPAKEEAGAALTARAVSVAHGARVALREVDLTLPEGSVTALMGRNGAGKSTLLWALQGSGRRDAGRVDVAGQDPAEVSAARRRRLVGLVPQTPADLLYLETVAEECLTADREAETPTGSTRALLDRLVPGVDPDAHPRDLSEGQRLALVLALVLVSKPRVLLLDEPTRGLDYTGKAALVVTLRRLADEGHAVVLATHDVELVVALADRTVVLAGGEVVSDGPTREVVMSSPAFAPQVAKILAPLTLLTVDEVARALREAG
jgi:energy-coupling factor transport system ATP-binding protein